MEPLPFAKGHGTGNDFVIIPDPEGRLVLTPKLVARLCDRRFGIGADGVLRVVRAAAMPEQPGSGAEWFMDYRNADGSAAEMCGNGIRVFARYLVEEGLVATGEVAVDTRAGPTLAVVTEDAVSVTMALPQVDGEGIARLSDGLELPGVAVDCGNPHLVCRVPAGHELAGLDLSGPPIVDPAQFPEGVNVAFTAHPPGDPAEAHHIRMRIHERGVGETLSCGSGACAAAAVVLREDACPGAGQPGGGLVTVDVPGGRLLVSLVERAGGVAGGCVLTGPAVVVARGTVEVAVLT